MLSYESYKLKSIIGDIKKGGKKRGEKVENIVGN